MFDDFIIAGDSLLWSSDLYNDICLKIVYFVIDWLWGGLGGDGMCF